MGVSTLQLDLVGDKDPWAVAKIMDLLPVVVPAGKCLIGYSVADG
jgi:hypothetical protein